MNDTDQQLLARFVEQQAEEAFAELVSRHLDLVYSAALRQVRSWQLAQDVAQSVFNDLARSAASLKKDTILSAWLYEVTRRSAIDLVRREARRQLREQTYTEMSAINATTDDWHRIQPHLDEAMAELDRTDRAAVLLRFFENKSLRDVGRELGVSDDAAQKRVSRAVDRLRDGLVRRGVSVGAGGLAVIVSTHAVQAAPAGLAAAISTGALANGAAALSGGAVTAKVGALQKVLIGGAISGMVGAVLLVLHPWSKDSKSGHNEAIRQMQTTAANEAPVSSGNAKETPPDPVKLLRGVARARKQIHSGSAEFQYVSDRMNFGHRDTKQWRFMAAFDQKLLHFESFGHEYSYAFDEDEAKQNEITKRADSMEKESAIRAGLLNEFASHHALVCDGIALYDYWQTSDHSADWTTIRAMTNGTGTYIFDPRCLGLSIYWFLGESVDDCLPFSKADLVGEEDLDGNATYHVRVPFPGGGSADYWIDKAHPELLLQVTSGLDIVKSRYDASDLKNPIPLEVNSTHFANGILSDTSRLLCTSSSYNTPVPAETFTLAGLGMPVGTEVNDDRIYRRIGYWTGSGLAEQLPSRQASSNGPPKLEELLSVLNDDPASTNARDAAIWIILNTPDGPAVQRAADVIQREHTQDTNLVLFCQELDRVRPECAKDLLATLARENPSAEVRGNASFTLATVLKDQAKDGLNAEMTARAIEEYQRVIADFSGVKQRGYSLAELARPELSELQRLTIGKPAPETQGVDLDGHPLTLSAYRGRVTVLVFWSGQFTEALKFRKLRDDMAGKSFALLSVNCDVAGYRDEESFKKVDWPTFKDGRDGPISKLWNVRSWPDVWVLDRQGIIRYRNPWNRNLADIVNELLNE